MPVIAVAAAAYGGAALAGFAGVTLGTFGTIAAIGAVTAGVGVVTGSKDLMKVGAVMGLVGGVGALAQSAGVLGAAPGGTVDPAVAYDAGQGAQMFSAPEATAPGAVAQEALKGVVQTGAPDVSASSGGTAAATPAAQAGAPATGILGGTVDPAVAYDAAQGTQLSPPPSIVTRAKEFAQPMMAWAEKNQMLSYGMVTIGGQFAQGLFDTTKESKTKLENAQAGFYEQRTANMSAPAPVVRAGARRDVYGSSPRPIYNAPGLINSPVTGRPA